MTRRGFSMLEMMVAAALLTCTMAMVAQMLGRSNARRRDAGHHRIAVQEAANVMERLSVRPFDELTPDGVANEQLSPQATESLREGVVEVHVSEVAGEPDARRIGVAVRWRGRPAQPAPSVELVTWRYRR